MPLGSKGKTLLGKFESQYGAKKGKSVFYATENKNPKFAAAVKKK